MKQLKEPKGPSTDGSAPTAARRSLKEWIGHCLMDGSNQKHGILWFVSSEPHLECCGLGSLQRFFFCLWSRNISALDACCSTFGFSSLISSSASAAQTEHVNVTRSPVPSSVSSRPSSSQMRRDVLPARRALKSSCPQGHLPGGLGVSLNTALSCHRAERERNASRFRLQTAGIFHQCRRRKADPKHIRLQEEM